MSESVVNEENILRILVATDIHLGFNEKDVIRGDDSFIAFEEILKHAVVNNVDFILLGGDLFHEANPSQNSFQKCLRLLRKYTLGDKPIAIEFLSDQAINFQEACNQSVNYEDPNINIAYPVFSIHGNHDDPSGFGRLSSLDILSTTGLINYFGKCLDLTGINIRPILMRKGLTQLALYGLSHIHDNRLARLFRDSKVALEKPDKTTGDWFNIFVIHQNRADRGPKNYVPQEILPDFLDLIIWGHEHDCRIQPEEIPGKNFFITQPGSSVATSLSRGEALEKNVGLLEIHGTEFQITPIKLQTVRPFVFKSVNLDDLEDELSLTEGDNLSKIGKVKEYIASEIENLIREANTLHSTNPNQPKQPLIRLRILYSDEDYVFNAIRLGQQYNERVANPSDMIVFKKNIRRTKNDIKPINENALRSAFKAGENDEDEAKIQNYIDRYFGDPEVSKHLEILFPANLSLVCRRLVDHNDDDAADRIIEFTKKRVCEFLNNRMPNEDAIDEELSVYHLQSDDIHQATLKMLDECGIVSRSKTSAQTDRDGDSIMNVDTDEKGNTVSNVNPPSARSTASATSSRTEAVASTSRGRGRGGRGSRGGRTAAATDKESTATNSRAKQSSIHQSFSSASTRALNRPTPNRKVVYVIDSEDDSN